MRFTQPKISFINQNETSFIRDRCCPLSLCLHPIKPRFSKVRVDFTHLNNSIESGYLSEMPNHHKFKYIFLIWPPPAGQREVQNRTVDKDKQSKKSVKSVLAVGAQTLGTNKSFLIISKWTDYRRKKNFQVKDLRIKSWTGSFKMFYSVNLCWIFNRI